MSDEQDRPGVVVGPSSPEVVGSEFAEVAVSVDHEGNGPRLKLEDLRTGRVRYLDALELETVVWLPDGHLRQLLDPSAHRWREDK
ncbi:hypothetical protein [Thermocrispum municipale]|jgi:hypothetical protein|uniref:hypothetical protein n=1 Tax=Thermocrispum municipale TaxID=37926 RepID=UPI0003F67FDC|nr:hypothetical protein [Thermocrispum municipale]